MTSDSKFDEREWVIQIRQTLDEELEEEPEIPVSIFNVPKTLMASDPVCYVPQQVALGPYHYWHPELYEMQRYKLCSAKRTQKHLKILKFHNLVDQFIDLEPKVRAYYHKYLDFNGETLAWMMAVDASFLLEFLQVYAVKEGGVLLRRLSSKMSHFVDIAGKKTAHHAILRDIVMLENQIPLFLLRKMLEIQFSSIELGDGMLISMLIGFCKELSPFKTVEEYQNIHVKDRAHLLDLLYHIIVPKLDQPAETIANDDQNEVHHAMEEGEGDNQKVCEEKSSETPGYVKQFLDLICKFLSKLNKGPIRLMQKVILSRCVKVIIKLPWAIISNIPVLSFLTKPIQYLFFSDDKDDEKAGNENSSCKRKNNKPPLVEEISIPSISELFEAGVRFVPTKGGIMTIRFDTKTFTLYLPTISLDGNTEVILRNLVAYEACNASGPLVFTRYTELMNGIIDTEEDVKLLRGRGIILNHLKSDKEVANLWNGMSKSVRLTKVPFLDKAIEDVNKYYNGRWKVKFGKFMKVYVFGSWQCLTLLAAILLLILMSLQAFCSVYTCSRIFHIKYIQ